jgi:RHS repeat-associated protein
MLMPNRHGSDVSASEQYSYGMGGMEKDNEINGNNNSYTTLFRQYDPRIGRWLSLDPAMKKYPFQSPYAAFNDNPMYFTDPFGDDPPENRKLNQNINGGAGDKSKAGDKTDGGFYADVSMSNGNTNNPSMAFPIAIAKANNMSVQDLYDLNPGLNKETSKEIGQGQFIRTEKARKKSESKVYTHFFRGQDKEPIDKDNFWGAREADYEDIPVGMIPEEVIKRFSGMVLDKTYSKPRTPIMIDPYEITKNKLIFAAKLRLIGKDIPCGSTYRYMEYVGEEHGEQGLYILEIKEYHEPCKQCGVHPKFKVTEEFKSFSNPTVPGGRGG